MKSIDSLNCILQIRFYSSFFVYIPFRLMSYNYLDFAISLSSFIFVLAIINYSKNCASSSGSFFLGVIRSVNTWTTLKWIFSLL